MTVFSSSDRKLYQALRAVSTRESAGPSSKRNRELQEPPCLWCVRQQVRQEFPPPAYLVFVIKHLLSFLLPMGKQRPLWERVHSISVFLSHPLPFLFLPLSCVHLQLDHNASRACNHNAFRHDFILTRSARKKPLIFIPSGNGRGAYQTFWVQKRSNYYLWVV